MKNCHCETEINRDGSGQLGRYLKALDPTYAPIDGRTTEDLLVFAKKYAAQIRFYDIPESNIQDPTDAEKISWREFFRRDMAVIASSIALTETENFKKEYDQANEKLQTHPTPEIYAALYAPIVGMIKKIDRWYSVAIPENPLYEDLKLAIDSDLKAQVKKIVAYDKGFTYVDPTVDLKIDLDGIENRDAWGLNEIIHADPGIYTGTSQQDKIWSASLFTEDVFHAFYNFLNILIRNSEKYIVFAMEQFPAHQPHMALFITFLQLFGKVREQMNGLTGRMLDFYYKEVLHLEAKPSLPDKAHIVFELAKEVAEYNLEMGTTLVAGPDKSNIEQIYRTSDDLVINQAKVKELKTIFIEKIEKGTPPITGISTIYARPVANSEDGFGEKFTGTEMKWPTFGVGSPLSPNPKNTCEEIEYLKEIISRKDQARIGFAIASPQLLMQGGKRLIRLKLNSSVTALFARQEKLAAANKGNLFEIWFSGEKEWFKVDKFMSKDNQLRFERFLPLNTFNPATDDIESSYYLDVDSFTLIIYLAPSSPSVIEYDQKLHKAYAYATTYPVMQVLLNPFLELEEHDYNDFSANGLTLKVKVGSIFPDPQVSKEFFEKLIAAGKPLTKEELISFSKFQFDGLTELVLQSDKDGLLKAGKPFDPFTAYPVRGKSFFIGSREAFNKEVDQMAIFIKKTIDNDKDSKASSSTELEYEVSILEKRKWKDLTSLHKQDFTQDSLKTNILNKETINENDDVSSVGPHIHPRVSIESVTEWEPKTENGFLRITNLKSVVVADNETIPQASQNLAPVLEIKEVSLSYETTFLTWEEGKDEFFHVYPFGNVETYVSYVSDLNGGSILKSRAANMFSKIDAIQKQDPFAIADKKRDYLLVNAGNLLLPHFTYVSPYAHYTPTATRVQSGNLNARRSAANKNGDELAEKLILDASGWATKINGGDNQYSSPVQEEGMLFIGLEKVKPLQSISMLFQFAEGSAKDEDQDSPEIHWSYLTYNEWRPLKEESIVSDGTSGFQTTGIVKIELPQDASTNNTIISHGLHWLCASVTNNSHRIPMLIDIVTQAVEVSFEDHKNDPSHFDLALPAGNISKLENPVAEVNKVIQPFASFDGKHQEIGKEFYTRVSERLRHKARAITPWDYEHLVLDRFPSIYKVKCITHTDPECLCREPEREIQLDPSVSTGCGIGIVELKYKVGLRELVNAEIEKRLLEIIEILKKGTECKISIMASSTNEGSSIDLNNSRLSDLVELITKSGIETNRIDPKLEEKGETQIVTISEISDATKKDSDVSKNAFKEVCCGPQIAPGHVLLIPISNLKNRNAVNPLQPKTSRRVLLEIEAYLKKRVSPFVHVHAKNPVYEEILVFFRVKFTAGKDKGFHLKKLNEEIVHFLTPWAFSDIAEVKFGQKIYASSIINFIEERNYVDFITDFLMLVCRTGCCDEIIDADHENEEEDVLRKISGCNDMEVLLQEDDDFVGDIIATPSTARSILISAPRHIIIPYQEPEIQTPCEKRKLNLLTTSKLNSKAKTEEISKAPTPASDPVKKTIKAVSKIAAEQIHVPFATETEKVKVKDTIKTENKTADKKQSVKAAKKEKKAKKKK